MNKKRLWLKKLGVFFIILSFVLYGSLLLVPFTPYTTATKTIIGTILVISGETVFWIGAFIVGREAVIKYRKYLNPLKWFNKKDKQQ